MVKGRNQDRELLELAALGARVKIAELEAQLAELRRRFPRASRDSTTATAPVVRKRRGMSAAQRKAVSLRMKKRWAEWRKKKGT
jgi:hypothetical protein